VATTQRTRKPAKPISERQRAKDEQLREELRNFDLKKFDEALEKAIDSQPQREIAHRVNQDNIKH
jgi:hypothetical protein